VLTGIKLSAHKACTYCLICIACIGTLYVDVISNTHVVLIVYAVGCLTVYGKRVLRTRHGVLAVAGTVKACTAGAALVLSLGTLHVNLGTAAAMVIIVATGGYITA
jgi:hypothetical protein